MFRLRGTNWIRGYLYYIIYRIFLSTIRTFYSFKSSIFQSMPEGCCNSNILLLKEKPEAEIFQRESDWEGERVSYSVKIWWVTMETSRKYRNTSLPPSMSANIFLPASPTTDLRPATGIYIKTLWRKKHERNRILSPD